MVKTIAFILLRLIATLLAVTFLTFAMVALIPGDAVDAILGTGPREPGVEEQIREDLNLDDPFLVRYFSWLGDAVTGDLGDSYVTDQPVRDTISQRVPVTAQLAIMAVLIAVIVAIPIGVLGAYKQSKWQDSVTSAGVQVALSIPNFIVGIFLIWLLAVQWDLL
ncbi:MAG TPA: ABC transporter permease, partial [Ilumatobacteraceae bacterium]|nr:ABC transporter permease [Ilumatobacteraceae bacterium]